MPTKKTKTSPIKTEPQGTDVGNLNLSFLYTDEGEESMTPCLTNIECFNEKREPLSISLWDLLSLSVQNISSIIMMMKQYSKEKKRTDNGLEEICLEIADLIAHSHSDDQDKFIKKLHKYMGINVEVKKESTAKKQ
jgi:protein-tyrosine phosphatase